MILRPGEVERIGVRIFDVAYNIIGGREEGDKTQVEIKEQADHSLPYMLAAAILDGEVTPRQYLPERIGRQDVQTLCCARCTSSHRRRRLDRDLEGAGCRAGSLYTFRRQPSP
jgi:hypothetical protein